MMEDVDSIHNRNHQPHLSTLKLGQQWPREVVVAERFCLRCQPQVAVDSATRLQAVSWLQGVGETGGSRD